MTLNHDFPEFTDWINTMDRHQSRLGKLRRILKKSDVGALLVTNFTNVSYLTGFTGDDSYLLVTPDHEILLSDPRYTVQLKEECPDLDLAIRGPSKGMMESIHKVVRKSKLSQLGIESGSMTVAVKAAIAEKLPKIELVDCENYIEQLREIKDKHEIKSIREAVTFAERAFDVVRASLRSQQSERVIAHELERQIRLFGGDRCSFRPIVAVGPRAALPHAVPQDHTIGESVFVLIDWGADSRDGYKSDLTRVLLTGKILPKFERIYRTVLRAQQQAIRAIRPGITARRVDAVARKVIAAAGFGRYFGHGLGHGLGMDIHESPRMNSRTKSPLLPGMVVTVEPGIYLPGFGGVRLEDDVLVTRDGHEVLTSVAKRFEDVQVEV